MKTAEGMIRILVFFILLLLVFWGLNVYKHIRGGGWRGLRRAVDLLGALLLLGLLLFTLMPVLR
ncbi:MAG: hypothetical protein IJ071_11265 [Ruminococcus sp.]|nr:hypothetical protein [Ruminococcus sp.]